MIQINDSNKPLFTNPEMNICFVKTNTITGDVSYHYGKNIITTDGNKFYAQKAAEDSSITSDFAGASGRMELRTGSATPANTDTYTHVTTPVTTSRKIITSGYPMTADTDTDNTGSGATVVTWVTSWTTSDFNATGIIGGCIHIGAASPVSGTKLLTHFSISSFDKTSSDTLKVFVNHTFLGV